MDTPLEYDLVCPGIDTVGELYNAFFKRQYNLRLDSPTTEGLSYLYDLAQKKCQCADKESLCNICTLVINTKELSAVIDKFSETSALMTGAYPLEELTDDLRARAESDFENMSKMRIEKVCERIVNYGELIYLNFKDSHSKIVKWHLARL